MLLYSVFVQIRTPSTWGIDAYLKSNWIEAGSEYETKDRERLQFTELAGRRKTEEEGVVVVTLGTTKQGLDAESPARKDKKPSIDTGSTAFCGKWSSTARTFSERSAIDDDRRTP